MVENETLSNAAALEDAPEDVEPEAEPTAADEEAPAPTPAGQASLTLKRGGVETEEVFTFGSPAVIGRFDPAVGPVEVDLGVLDEGRYVSRKHAKITCEDGVWRVHDLGSSNGTYLLRSDFERVDEAELTDGSELAFGNARFVFRVSPSAEPVAEEQPEPEGA